MELKERTDQARALDKTHTEAITPSSPVCGAGIGGVKCHEAITLLWEGPVAGWGEAHMAAIHRGLNVSQTPGSECSRH